MVNLRKGGAFPRPGELTNANMGGKENFRGLKKRQNLPEEG